MSQKASKTGIIILAAGASTRMGQPKQLLHFKGEILIRSIIKIALTTECRPVVIILGAYYDVIKKELQNYDNAQLGIVLVENQLWQQGMSTSVKIGLETLLAANPNVESVLFLLTDQPLLTSTHLLNLLDYKDLHTIIASYYNDRAGVPALFDRKWFPELMQLTGDQGARKLLALHPAEVHAIPFPEGAFDLDTPEDYKFLIQYFG